MDEILDQFNATSKALCLAPTLTDILMNYICITKECVHACGCTHSTYSVVYMVLWNI